MHPDRISKTHHSRAVRTSRNKVRMLVSLTSFLHEAEQFVEELLPLGVVVDLVELKEKRRWRYRRSILSFEGRRQLLGSAALSNFDAAVAATSSFYGRSNHPRVKFCQSVSPSVGRTGGQPSIRLSVCPILDRIIQLPASLHLASSQGRGEDHHFIPEGSEYQLC